MGDLGSNLEEKVVLDLARLAVGVVARHCLDMCVLRVTRNAGSFWDKSVSEGWK